jgi:hypothetical protein
MAGLGAARQLGLSGLHFDAAANERHLLNETDPVLKPILFIGEAVFLVIQLIGEMLYPMPWRPALKRIGSPRHAMP